MNELLAYRTMLDQHMLAVVFFGAWIHSSSKVIDLKNELITACNKVLNLISSSFQ